jgi:lysozyme family protein
MITKTQFLNAILPFTLNEEGGYNKGMTGDSGGETYRGIARNYNPKWKGWAVIDKIKPLKYNQVIKSLEPMVQDFYWNLFTSNGFHNLNSIKVALACFDFEVNGGFSYTRLSGIIKEGFGQTANTTSAIITTCNNLPPNTLAAKIVDNRAARYNWLIKQKPVLEKFRKNWFARLARLRVYLNIAAEITGILLLTALITGIYYSTKTNLL